MSVEPLPPRLRAAASGDPPRYAAPRTVEVGRQLRSVYVPLHGSGEFEDVLQRLDSAERCFN